MNTFLEKINPSSDTPLHSQFHTLLETCFLKDHRQSLKIPNVHIAGHAPEAVPHKFHPRYFLRIFKVRIKTVRFVGRRSFLIKR